VYGKTRLLWLFPGVRFFSEPPTNRANLGGFIADFGSFHRSTRVWNCREFGGNDVPGKQTARELGEA